MSDEISRFVAYWTTPGVRERILGDRRKRYHEDPEFRQSEIERVSKTKKRGPGRGRRRGSSNRPMTIEIDGKTVVLLSLGDAAKRIGVTKSAFRGYDDRRVIPKNHMIDGLGRRWYPEGFIEWLQPFFVGQSQKRRPLWELQARVERAWPSAQVPKIVEEQHGQRSGSGSPEE